MNIADLLALSDQDLTVRFYRDVLGWRVRDTEEGRDYVGYSKYRYALAQEGKGAIGFYPTEPEAWSALPPVSAETWLKAMDELPTSLQFEFGLDIQGEPEIILWDRDSANILFRFNYDKPLGITTEALKRAVLVASVYLAVQSVTEGEPNA